MAPNVTAVVVSYRSPRVSDTLDSLMAQSCAVHEVLLVDNDPDTPVEGVEGVFERLQILRPSANLGYTGAANLAAGVAMGEWLWFLNPDAVAASDCLAALIEAIDGPDVAVVGAQVLLPDGRVNAGANPVNLAGISWSGGYGRPQEHAPPRDVAAVSGASLLVHRERFLQLGGLCPYFFLYVDDTDLAWRVRLGGGRVRYCPAAVVVHEYEFDKGRDKWFYLERNRLWALLSNLQLRTLVLLAPVLLATEGAVLARAARDGWLREKLRAWVVLLASAPALLRWRRHVQGARRVGDALVLGLFVGGIDTDLPEMGMPAWVNASLERYRRLVLRLLGAPED
jgi:GT2 family glycosyltransferase